MATRLRSSDVLFRAAGGPRVGFGHLVRVRSLARALGIRARLSVRGGAEAHAAARALGMMLDAARIPTDLDGSRIRVLVVDDPSQRAAAPWIRAARRLGISAVSVHDLGLAPVASDLAIDGSVRPGAHTASRRALRGLSYAVLDPEITGLVSRPRRSARVPKIVVGLGGGLRSGVAARLAHAIKVSTPGVDVRLATGFVATEAAAGVRVIRPAAFRRELAGASAAVLAGGVSLYEACALGVPTVALSVVPGQRRTVRAFGRIGAAIDGGHLVASQAADVERAASRVARRVTMLLARPDVRQRLSQIASGAIDGGGGRRVAEAVDALVRQAGVHR